MAIASGVRDFYIAKVPTPRSVNLTEWLSDRVDLAMKASGSEQFTEFARGAFLDRCRKVESELRQQNPEEYKRLYQGKEYFAHPEATEPSP